MYRNTVMSIWDFIAIPCVFFDSIIRDKERNSIKVTYAQMILNTLFAIFMSIPIGFVAQIVLGAYISVFMDAGIVGSFNVYGPLLIFVILEGIVLMNYNDATFSLPRSFLDVFIIVSVANPVKGMLKTLLFLALWTSLIMLCLIQSVSIVNIPEPMIPYFVMIVFVLSTCITMLIYVETTKNERQREKRQFGFSLLIFALFLAMSTIYMAKYLTLSTESAIFVVITVAGLLLSMTTVIDKGRILYDSTLFLKCKEIDLLHEKLEEKYGYEKFVQIFVAIICRIRVLIDESIQRWNKGDTRLRIRMLTTIILISILFVKRKIMIAYVEMCSEYVSSALGALGNMVLALFNGNERIMTATIVTMLVVCFIIWEMYRFIMHRREYSILNKVTVVARVEMALIILLFCIEGLFDLQDDFLTNYLMIPLYIGFFITMITYSVIDKMLTYRAGGSETVSIPEPSKPLQENGSHAPGG